MASYLDKVQVNTAITDSTKLDLGHTSITTQDFFQLNVATIMELVPGSKIDVNMETFARLNPLVVPTFGRASIRNRAFFVPFSTCFRAWHDMITESVHVASDGYSTGNYNGTLVNYVPMVSMETLCDAFLNSVGQDSSDGSGFLYQVAANQNLTNVDVSYTSGGNTTYFCYTVKGRQAVKLLEQLGYKLDWQAPKDTYLSAMPLLALAKIFVDWYFPQQYSNRVEYDILLALCNKDVNAGPVVLTWSEVNTILSLCMYVQYDSDLFVSAWDQPNSPNAGNYYSNYKLVNLDTMKEFYGYGASPSAKMTYDENGYVSNYAGASSATGSRIGYADAPFITPMVEASAPNSSKYMIDTPISEYLLHSLHALTDYMKRHQLAGSRAFDRYLARFGKALPAEKMNRSLYLGASMQDIQIGDVMSTADTLPSGDISSPSGAALGAFSGKGLSYGRGQFSFSTDEFGYFIILSSIVPATGYFQGIDPLVLRKNRLQFWTPEFDNLGVEPITAASLYIPQLTGQMNSGDAYSQVFGFVPRYATYKAPTCMDRLTGNFRIPSLNNGAFINSGNAWHLMRTFKPGDFSADYANVVHSPSFISGGADFSQYKRLFYEDDADSPDNFTVIHNFEIAEYAPMKPLYDTYDFEDKGKKVTLETNGVKLN